MSIKTTIFWHRRDLRIHDNVGLFQAVKSATQILPIFIFDTSILDELPESDARVSFIYDCIQELQKKYQDKWGQLHVYYGEPQSVFESILDEHDVDTVITNRDYEPYAKERDQQIEELLKNHNIKFQTYKDSVVFEKDEVVKDDGDPYVVYTPYMRQWKSQFSEDVIQDFSPKFEDCQFVKQEKEMPTLKKMGFKKVDYDVTAPAVEESIIENYHETRDVPHIKGTSRLSVHLRFGTMSIREVVRKTKDLNEKYWNELIWRDFYQMILWHFPNTVHESFRKKYDAIPWRNNKDEFEAWKEGKTGYPIIDAGMRELNQSGYMHNRVRMVVASFLTKHLLIDWRWGEAYFAEKLMDFELASNVGGWQWAAGSGVDAAPYFRVFNPELQLKKFDPELKYVRQWVEEYDELTYPQPIVNHKEARERALSTYKKALS